MELKDDKEFLKQIRKELRQMKKAVDKITDTAEKIDMKLDDYKGAGSLQWSFGCIVDSAKDLQEEINEACDTVGVKR